MNNTTDQCNPTPMKTPLYDAHMRLGGKMVEYAGWLLPLQYEGLVQEHKAVRENAGLFDVSHMGEFTVSGPDAGRFLDYLLTRSISDMPVFTALYTLMCADDGGILDDLLVLRLGKTSYLLIVNAANRDADGEWILERAAGYDMKIREVSDEYALIALQGPNAERLLRTLGCAEAAELDVFHFTDSVKIDGVSCLVSRTGYTGEDGFEILVAAEKAEPVWQCLLDIGISENPTGGASTLHATPCGLGCRDTLRFEAGMTLYGNELSRDITPLEAGLARYVQMDKPSFAGKSALSKQQHEGVPRRLIGFEVLGRGIARQGYTVCAENGSRRIGTVTTGYPSPTLGRVLGVALIETAYADKEDITVEIRGMQVPVQLRSRIFYKRKGR